MNDALQIEILKTLVAKIEELDAEFIKTATERPSDTASLLAVFRKRREALAFIATIASYGAE